MPPENSLKRPQLFDTAINCCIRVHKLHNQRLKLQNLLLAVTSWRNLQRRLLQHGRLQDIVGIFTNQLCNFALCMLQIKLQASLHGFQLCLGQLVHCLVTARTRGVYFVWVVADG